MTIASGQIIMASDIIQLQNRIADLETKLRNVETSSVKKTDVIKYITPNYKNGVTSRDLNYKKGDEIIMEKSGVVMCFFITEDWGTYATVNGVRVCNLNCEKIIKDSIFIPVKKGDRFAYHCKGEPGDPTEWERSSHFIIFYYEQQ